MLRRAVFAADGSPRPSPGFMCLYLGPEIPLVRFDPDVAASLGTRGDHWL